MILDKFTVQEKVVPLLKGIKTKEPGVMMAVLRVFKQVAEVADSDYLAMEVLPLLWQFSLGPLLNLQQFQAFMALIKALSGKSRQGNCRRWVARAPELPMAQGLLAQDRLSRHPT